VVGITNALNVVADVTNTSGLLAVVSPVDEKRAEPDLAPIFDDVRAFYARPDIPLPFRIAALDPRYLGDIWQATRRAFDDNRLSRKLKESLAFAVSVTSRSSFGTAFHGGEMRRLGVGTAGILEVLGVTQMFSSYTKIADTLHLDPDMAHMAPIDPSPAPGCP